MQPRTCFLQSIQRLIGTDEGFSLLQDLQKCPAFGQGGERVPYCAPGGASRGKGTTLQFRVQIPIVQTESMAFMSPKSRFPCQFLGGADRK